MTIPEKVRRIIKDALEYRVGNTPSDVMRVGDYETANDWLDSLNTEDDWSKADIEWDEGE